MTNERLKVLLENAIEMIADSQYVKIEREYLEEELGITSSELNELKLNIYFRED